MKHLNDVLTFLDVVECGSFTAAAEKVGQPKSNLSRKLARLEQTLGTRLMERSTRRLHLTEAGRIYYQHARRAHEELIQGQDAVDHLLEQPRGHLKVSASVTIGQQLVKPMLAPFLRQYSEISMELKLTNRRVDLIEEGFDIVIRVGRLPDANLIARRLGQSRRKLVASKVLLQERGRPERLSELGGLPCIMMEDSDKGHWLFEQGEKAHKLALDPVLVVDDFACLHQCIVEGLGIGALPDYMCTHPELVELVPDWALQASDIFAVYPSHRGATPKVRAFLDALTQRFSSVLNIKN